MGISKVTITIRHLFLALILVTLSPVSRAQNAGDLESQYRNAKELFDMGKYGLAMQAFKPMTSAFNENIYMVYASYYYAVAAYKNNDKDLAKSMFLQIVANFGNWDQIDEVRLWLYKISLDQGNYKMALNYLGSMERDDLWAEAKKFKAAYLARQSMDFLQQMLHEYPSDKLVADALAGKIILQPLQDQDRALLENLVSVYELDSERYRINEEEKSVKKKEYQVAVLLPFMYNEIKYTPERISNQFVLDLYQGIQLGLKSLKDQGIRISLHAYDTKKDSLTTARILALPELQHMDLIIGPLWPAPVRLASQFSFDYRINMVNPLSTNSEIVANNPYALLFMPTLETMAIKTAEFTATQVRKKTAIIFYGEAQKDSLLAFNYKLALENKGHVVKHIEEIKSEESKRILDILTRTISVDYTPEELDSIIASTTATQGNLRVKHKEYLMIRPNEIGQVFIASEDAPLAANTITALQTRGDSIILVGLEEWMNSRVITMEALENLNAHLIAPRFIDKNSPRYLQMKAAYEENAVRLPNDNNLIGFEIMSTMGKLVYRWGNHFQFEAGAQLFMPGSYDTGYWLDGKNSNQFVQIIKFRDSALVVANSKNQR